MEYLIHHWRGKQTLGQSFWINLVVGLLVIYTIEFLIHRHLDLEFKTFAIISISYFVLFHVLVFLWQSAGVLRVCDHNIKNYISSGWTRAAQFGVITAFAATLIWGVTLGQSLWRLKIDEQEQLAELNKQPTYTFEISTAQVLQINGILNPGITRETKKLLAENQQITTIELNSTGGNIFEARGLAKLIQLHNLNTHIAVHCFSSCATAFIAGNARTLENNARLGFHQYKIDSKKLHTPNLNVKKEQDKDLAFFIDQGVNREFLDKAFSTPFEQMWFPSRSELISAGVVEPTNNN